MLQNILLEIINQIVGIISIIPIILEQKVKTKLSISISKITDIRLKKYSDLVLFLTEMKKQVNNNNSK